MLEVSIALHDTLRNKSMLDGRIAPDGIRLHGTPVHGSEMFWRQLKFGDFDVSEMSLSSLLIAIANGDTRWVGLPVYTMRAFFHTGIMIRTDKGIHSPADLKGKRVGVPEYQQTSAVWSRGVLQHEFGVSPHEIEWFMERVPEVSHGGTSFTPPPGVVVNRIPGSTNIGEMMLAGTLDATLLYLRERNLVDRSRADLSVADRIAPLFPDPQAEGQRYFAKTGLLPINHIVVVRRSLLERHPWVALNLYKAFLRAKEELMDMTRTTLEPYLQTGLLESRVGGALAADPMAYGVKAARPVLEAVTQYVFEQGLTPRRVALDEIFAASTLDM